MIFRSIKIFEWSLEKKEIIEQKNRTKDPINTVASLKEKNGIVHWGKIEYVVSTIPICDKK